MNGQVFSDAHALAPIAAVDIGSNSISLTLARVDNRGKIEVLARHKAPARLADAIQPDKTMSPDGIRRAVETLKHFREVATEHKAHVMATATAAVRAARNRRDFLKQAEAEAGIHVELISGQEEACLTYQGVLYGLPDLSSARLLCVDVGGGSTELVVGRGGDADRACSIKVGAVNISGRHLRTDPVGPEQVANARRHLARALGRPCMAIKALSHEHAVATSGSIQRITRIALALGLAEPPTADAERGLHGVWLSREALFEVVARLVSAPTQAERLAIPGMDPQRADVLLGGALIFEMLTRKLDLPGWTISTAALRTGIILESLRRQTSAAAAVEAASNG